MSEKKLEVPNDLLKYHQKTSKINMYDVIGEMDIVFLCYDTLRYDAAIECQNKGTTSNINAFEQWSKCQAVGNFTYPSHHGMFAGFFPLPYDANDMFDRNMLFFSKNIGMGRKAPEGAFEFDSPTIMDGLAKVGYQTICIGGVGFFNKRTALNSVFPAMFEQSYWTPKFGCLNKESAKEQFNWAAKILDAHKKSEKVFLYVNLSAIHYPNYYYINGLQDDNIESHKAALEYIDRCLPILFEALKKRGNSLIIACSDHGTCYGEEGKKFHGINNDIVNTVPYMEFIL